MITGVQLIGIIFGLGMLYLTFLHQKRKEFSNKEYILWMFVWFAIIISAIFPHWLDNIVKQLRFSRPLDFLVVMGMLFIVGISFFTYTIVKKNQKKVEEMVQKLAIHEEEKSHK